MHSGPIRPVQRARRERPPVSETLCSRQSLSQLVPHRIQEFPQRFIHLVLPQSSVEHGSQQASQHFFKCALVFLSSSSTVNMTSTCLSGKQTANRAAGVVFWGFLNYIFDCLVSVTFEGVAGGCSLPRLYQCFSKTAQLLIPVTWKGVRCIS